MSKALKSNAKAKTPSDLFGAPDSRSRPAAKAAPRSGGAEDAYTAADIEVLEGLEPVRRRPGMYIGGTDEKAQLFYDTFEKFYHKEIPKDAASIHLVHAVVRQKIL